MKHKKDYPIFVIIIEIFLVKMDYMGGNVLGPSWILTGVFFNLFLSFKWQDSALLFEAFEDCVIIKINFKTISDDVNDLGQTLVSA